MYVSLLCGTPDKGQYDKALVATLVSVNRINLHSAELRRLQQSRDRFQLLSVGGDNTYITGLATCLKRDGKIRDVYRELLSSEPQWWLMNGSGKL